MSHEDETTMNDDPRVAEPKRISAREMRKLPLAERDAILEQMALLAEPFYRNGPELTEFEAFGPDDLFGESSSSETCDEAL